MGLRVPAIPASRSGEEGLDPMNRLPQAMEFVPNVAVQRVDAPFRPFVILFEVLKIAEDPPPGGVIVIVVPSWVTTST